MIDVVVVGGSLAGAATSTHLAARGHRVVLLERSQADDGRRKPCGEGLFPRGFRELRRLGVRADADLPGAPLRGVRFHAGAYAATASFEGDTTGLGVRRSDLDPLIRGHAVEAGVEVRTGVTVRRLVHDGAGFAGVETDEGAVVRARVVVGADGLRSRLRQQAGLDRPQRRRRYGVSAHLQLPDAVPPFVDIYFDDGAEVYVTPVGPSVVNVAVLLRQSAMHRFAGQLAPAFRALLDGHPQLAGGVLLDAPIAIGPFPASSRHPWRENLVLVGDAAGFVDAISGEGMSTSLVSARHCADAVSDHLEGGRAAAFERYEARRRALVRNADLLARLSLALSAQPAIARHSVRNLMRQPQTFARLLGVSAGELRFRDLRPRDLLALAAGI